MDRTATGLSRRQFTIGLFGTAALRRLPPLVGAALPLSGSLLLPTAGRAATRVAPDSPVARKFNVFWGKDQIGYHRFAVTPDGRPGDWKVRVDIDMRAELGWFGEFTYAHASREVWRDGRIVELESRTDDDGDLCQVSGRTVGQRFRLTGPAGTHEAQGRLLTSNSAWSEAICQEREIIDTTTGVVVRLVARPEDVLIDTGGHGPVRAYELTCPRITGSFWYDAAGLWMRSRLTRGRVKIDYLLDA